MRVHVGDRDDEVEVVVVVGVCIVGQAQLTAPALAEATPEEVADGHAIGLLDARTSLAVRSSLASVSGLALRPRS